MANNAFRETISDGDAESVATLSAVHELFKHGDGGILWFYCIKNLWICRNLSQWNSKYTVYKRINLCGERSTAQSAPPKTDAIGLRECGHLPA